MKIKEFIEDYKYVFQALAAALVVAISFATIREGYYVDENGLLTIYKGIYQGQRMFVDSWESLQTGSLVVWPLLALYFGVLQGPLAGIGIGYVLYMRIAYQLIRLIVAIFAYATFRKGCFKNGAFYGAIFWYMFVLSFDNFSYKSMCDMAIMLIICFIFRYYYSKKLINWVMTGLAVCAATLAYPTMIFVAVAIGAFIIYLMISKGIDKSVLIAFVVTCLACACLVLIFLQATSGLDAVMSQISYLGDQDYGDSLLVRLGKMLLSYLAFALVAYVPLIIMDFIRRYRSIPVKTEHIVLTLYWLVFFLGLCFIKLDSVSTSRFVYSLLILFFWFPYLAIDRQDRAGVRVGFYGSGIEQEKDLLWPIFYLSIAAQIVWAVSTNQEISVPGHMALYVVVADILIFAGIEDDKALDSYLSDEGAESPYRVLTGLLLAAGLFFMGFWVAESNGGYSDILEKRYYVTEGALQGIALSPDNYELNKASYDLVTQYLSDEDYLLVAFGSNSTGYINGNAHQGTYSVFARTQVNSKLLDYYSVNPNNQATYVIIDENNGKYEDFVAGETGQWILENYTIEVAREGSLVLLSR